MHVATNPITSDELSTIHFDDPISRPVIKNAAADPISGAMVYGN
jgi:hypothetical protein